jgi:hypothetical protein
VRRRGAAVGALAATALLVPVAVAATPGTYRGWLYKASGERWTATQTRLTVRDTDFGQRFELSTYNMRLACGDGSRARFRFVHRGVVEGAFIDDTRDYPPRRPTHRVRIRGTFVEGRFGGRVRVTAAPGRTRACTGAARVRVRR